MPKNTAQRIIDSARGVAGSGGAVVYVGSSGGSSSGSVPITRRVLAGAGLAVSPADGVLDEDLTFSLLESAAGAGLTYAAGVLAVGAGLGITVNGDDVALASNVAGNGLTYATGVLHVGAGALITAAADAVGITPGSNYQFVGTGAGTAAAWQNITDLAGAGLAAPAGVLNVGVSGLGLGVGADAVTLASSSDPGAAASILATSAAGLLKLYNGMFTQAAQSAATFASGFAGSGWRADYGITTAARASMETDDLTVRGRMRVYELLIQQIRATNGSVFVSSASKVVSVTTSSNPAWTVNGSQLTFNGSNATLTTTLYTINTAAAGDTSRELYHGFLVGDLIRAQQVQWNGSSFAGVILSNLEVTKVTNLYTYQGTLVNGDAAATGYDYVRVGNSVDPSRQGSIYLTSDDSAAPFIDIVDGINSHSAWNTPGAIKVRVGKLSGISDSDFGGPLDGYGIYASRAYIKGKVVVTGGSLGGLAAADVNSNTTTIDGGRITTGTILASHISTTTLAAIVADLGSVTAGQIVVGTTNKLWLNDAADGTLRIGGSVKASAPFQVSAAGHLNAIDAEFGSLLIDSSGAYVNATSAWDITAGYRFKQAGANAGGLTSRYTGTLAYTALLNNLTSEGGTAISSGVDTGLYLQSGAASGKTSQVVISAIRGTTTVGLVADNTSSIATVTVKADTLTLQRMSGTSYKVWNEYNQGASSGMNADQVDGKHAADLAWLSGATFTGNIVMSGNQFYFTNAIAAGSEPGYPSAGEVIVYLLNVGGGTYRLKWRGRDGSSVAKEGTIAQLP